MGQSGKTLNDVRPEYIEKHISITESVNIYVIISFNCMCSVGTALLSCLTKHTLIYKQTLNILSTPKRIYVAQITCLIYFQEH